MKPTVNLYKLGRLSYLKALNVQQVLFDKLKNQIKLDHKFYQSNKPLILGDGIGTGFQSLKSNSTESILNQRENSLILVEHEPVYTIGIRSKIYNSDYISELMQKLDERNLKADFVQTTRGGLITFHGPGQLVAYPIIYLGDFIESIANRSVKAYVKLLETTIIDTLSRIGIKNAHTTREYPGVWLDSGKRKIAFVGIACKRFATMHGISINCDCDLSWFDLIVSCGIEEKLITSISQELQLEYKLNLTNHDHVIETGSTAVKQHLYQDKISKSRALASDRGDGIDGSSDSKTNRLDQYQLSSVESISTAFCQSFSQNFGCNLREKSLDLTTIL